MDENLQETLQAIGLTQGEAKVYIASLGLGVSSVGPIVDKSGVSASKVYNILNRLLDKGLASLTVKDGLKLFTPADPESLISYVEQEQKRLDRHKEQAKAILPLLQAKKDTHPKKPVVELTRTVRGFVSLNNELLATAPVGSNYIAIAGSRMSFRLQSYWSEQSKNLSSKKISQYLIYTQDGWDEKDPKVHRRKERTHYYPIVLPDEAKEIPQILCMADSILITDEDADGLFSLVVRNKRLSEAFAKLIALVRKYGQVPEGFQAKEPAFD